MLYSQLREEVKVTDKVSNTDAISAYLQSHTVHVYSDCLH